MKINNVELEDVDIFDVDTAEKYEEAVKKVQEEAAASKLIEDISLSAMIRKQCNAVFNCFNTIFGEGTDKTVFGDKVNLMICLKAFEELIVNVNEQKKELEKLTSKYSPNRAQRRDKK
jgi:hypothetical protein